MNVGGQKQCIMSLRWARGTQLLSSRWVYGAVWRRRQPIVGGAENGTVRACVPPRRASLAFLSSCCFSLAFSDFFSLIFFLLAFLFLFSVSLGFFFLHFFFSLSLSFSYLIFFAFLFSFHLSSVLFLFFAHLCSSRFLKLLLHNSVFSSFHSFSFLLFSSLLPESACVPWRGCVSLFSSILLCSHISFLFSSCRIFSAVLFLSFFFLF